MYLLKMSYPKLQKSYISCIVLIVKMFSNEKDCEMNPIKQGF
jgi:hypothetical protein